MLDDPFLDLFKPVMIALEHTAGLCDIDALFLFCHPGKVEQEVEVIPDHGTFMILAASRFKFLELRECLLSHLVRHLCTFNSFPVPCVSGTRAFAFIEFFLDHFELFPQHCLPVRLAYLIGYFFCHLYPDGDVLFCPDEELKERDVPLPYRNNLKERLLFGKVDRAGRA